MDRNDLKDMSVDELYELQRQIERESHRRQNEIHEFESQKLDSLMPALRALRDRVRELLPLLEPVQVRIPVEVDVDVEILAYDRSLDICHNGFDITEEDVIEACPEIAERLRTVRETLESVEREVRTLAEANNLDEGLLFEEVDPNSEAF